MSFRSRWLVAAILALSLTGCGPSPESSVEGFYRAIEKGEITAAQGYLSAQMLNMMGPKKLAAAISHESERTMACGGIKDVKVQLQGQGEIRFGMVTITYGNEAFCRPRTERTKLIKEDGKWKIAPT